MRVDDAGTYAIAGGSALAALGSSQDLLPRKVTDPQAARGFADVGLRLAFDAPASAGLVSPVEALRKAVAALPTLPNAADADTNPTDFGTKLPPPTPSPSADQPNKR